MRFAWLVMLASGCVLDLAPLEGKACNLEHPCPGGYTCRRLVCTTAPSPEPRRDDGGVVWEQAVTGFSSSDVIAPATTELLTIDSNQLTVEIGAAPGDRALAVATKEVLPQSDDGLFGGVIVLRSPTMPQNVEFTFATLETADGESIAELYFVPSKQGVGLRSSLRPTPIWNGFAAENNYPSVSALYVPDRENRLAVRWKRNQFVALYLNGSQVERFTLPSSGLMPGARQPARLRLGVPQCSDCPMGTRLRLEYREWKLSGDGDAALEP